MALCCAVLCCATNRWFDPSWCHWKIFIDLNPYRSHCGPGVDLACNRNEYQEHFLGVKGGRCVRLTTYHYPVLLSCNLGTLTYRIPLGPPGPVVGLIYLYCPHLLTDYGEIAYSNGAIDVVKWSGSFCKQKRCSKSRRVNDVLRDIFYFLRQMVCP